MGRPRWWQFGLGGEEKTKISAEEKMRKSKKGEERSTRRSDEKKGWFKKGEEKSTPNAEKKEGGFRLPSWLRSLGSQGDEIANIEVQQTLQALPKKEAELDPVKESSSAPS